MVDRLPQICQYADRLLHQVYSHVGRFSRRHKYGVGAKLEHHAFQVAKAARDAWFDRSRLDELADAVSSFKTVLQLARLARAFTSKGAFEEVAETARSLGKQCGGWRRDERRKGQNSPAEAPAGRAMSLSSQPASNEAPA